MLVLCRRQGETIHIGKEVVITVRKIAGNQVKLAIDAPKHIRVMRGELLTCQAQGAHDDRTC